MGGCAVFLQDPASTSTLKKLNGSRRQMQGGMYHQLFMYFSLSLSVSPSHLCHSLPPPPVPLNALLKSAHMHTHTLMAMHAAPASTEELHERTHGCLFSVQHKLEHTHSKMAPSPLFVCFQPANLHNFDTLWYTLKHVHTGAGR